MIDDLDSDFISEVLDSLSEVIIVVFTSMFGIIESFLLVFVSFLAAFSNNIVGQFVVFLVFGLVGGNVVYGIYETNFKKDKIMDNKNKTGFFHPELNKKKNQNDEDWLFDSMRSPELIKKNLWFTDNGEDFAIAYDSVSGEESIHEVITELPKEPIFCKNCQNERFTDDIFCANCGYKHV